MALTITDLRSELLRAIKNLKAHIDRQDKKLADGIQAVNAKTQRVNTAVGPLALGVPQDVTITWPTPWPDTGYGVCIQLATGNNALGQVHATLKAGTKTVTDCIVTVEATLAVATVGVDVIGVRT